MTDHSSTGTLRAAVVGSGVMGRQHARIYAQHPRTELVAVVDPDHSRGRDVATEFGARLLPTVEALVDQGEVDVVSVASPTVHHHEATLELLRAGIHVLVEKPLAPRAAQAVDLAIAAERNGLVLAVGHVERFNPAVRQLKRMIEADALGRITSIVARRVGIMPPRIKDANIIVDLAIHDIDICNYLMRRQPTEIAAAAGRAHLSDRYDYAEIFLRYNGVASFVHANWITPIKIRDLSVTGTHGFAELNYITQELLVYRDGNWPEHNTFGEVLERGTAQPTAVAVEQAEPLFLEIDGFAKRVLGEGGEIMSAIEAVGAIEVAERALQAVEASHDGPVPSPVAAVAEPGLARAS